MTRRVIVCGGRDYADRHVVFKALDEVHARAPIDVLVQGGARGADLLAVDWARYRGVTVDTYPAQWERHGRGAGPRRNQTMVDRGADLVVAFPGGAGTADMVRRARQRGIEVLVRPAPSVYDGPTAASNTSIYTRPPDGFRTSAADRHTRRS